MLLYLATLNGIAGGNHVADAVEMCEEIASDGCSVNLEKLAVII
jgi:hypothetical protein